MILLSIIFMALLICHRIMMGDSLLILLPYYASCFAGLYVFLAISVVVNVQEKRNVLKISLVDYLENHLTPRLGSVPANLAKIRGEVPGKEQAANDRTKGVSESGRRVAGAETLASIQAGAQTKVLSKGQRGSVEKELQVLQSNLAMSGPQSISQSTTSEQSKRYQELSKLLEDFFAV